MIPKGYWSLVKEESHERNILRPDGELGRHLEGCNPLPGTGPMAYECKEALCASE